MAHFNIQTQAVVINSQYKIEKNNVNETGGETFGIPHHAEIKGFTQGLPGQVEKDVLTDTAIIKRMTVCLNKKGDWYELFD